MTLQSKSRLQFADWLAAERVSVLARTEFVDGVVFAMAGGSETHSLIASNIVGELRN